MGYLRLQVQRAMFAAENKTIVHQSTARRRRLTRLGLNIEKNLENPAGFLRKMICRWIFHIELLVYRRVIGLYSKFLKIRGL